MKLSYLILALGLATAGACTSEQDRANQTRYKAEIIALYDQLEEKVAKAQNQLAIGSIDPLNNEYKVIECYRVWRDYHFSTKEAGEHNWKYCLSITEDGKYDWGACIDDAVNEISESNLDPNLLKVGVKSSFEKHCREQITLADEFIYCADHLKPEPGVEIEVNEI
ncbi:MAG: hypothetical protein WCV90_06370 [Candidatus Woesearchaeota archaeon]|jgi:hypothetical protein